MGSKCQVEQRHADHDQEAAPAMTTPMVRLKSQKNCVGARCRKSPRRVGADSTYRNMPLEGMPLASMCAMQHGSQSSARSPRIRSRRFNDCAGLRAGVCGKARQVAAVSSTPPARGLSSQQRGNARPSTHFTALCIGE